MWVEHLVLTHYGARIKHTDELIDEAMKGVSKFRSKVSVPLLTQIDVGSDSGEVSHMRWCGDGWSS